MEGMFSQATSFNQDLSNWNTATVTDMESMFFQVRSFNQDLSNWNTAAVTDMESMFEGARSFNQDLSKWNVEAVTNMNRMFNGASSFTQVLCWTLNVEVSTFSIFMFENSGGSFDRSCVIFKPRDNRQDLPIAVDDWILNSTAAAMEYGLINSWDTSLITDMAFLFAGRSSFNDNISNWKTDAVTEMQFMFTRASSFNQDLSSWNVEAVTTMERMFNAATSFDQVLCWTLNEEVDLTGIFADSGDGSPGSGGSFDPSCLPP
jgi:surface protein